MPSHFHRAFTLIELLIVVVIIAILASIAVPNFLEAQTRAKVSRSKNDLRVLATALEAYAVDNNNYPYVQGENELGFEYQMPAGFPAFHADGPAGLTTPVAYISSALPDPFDREPEDFGAHRPSGKIWLCYERLGFTYDMGGHRYNPDGCNCRPIRVCVDGNGTLLGTAPDIVTNDPSLVPARYVLYSAGPDRKHRVYKPDGSILVTSRFSVLNRYDPTNGTISPGNIVRFPSGLSFP